jgi:hypothetical protein
MPRPGFGRSPPARACWLVALAAFGVLDVALTLVGVGTGLATEAHPLAAALLRQYGLWTLPVWKLAVVAGFYGLYVAVPRTYDLGVPLGLAILGVGTALWNAAVLLAVL